MTTLKKPNRYQGILVLAGYHAVLSEKESSSPQENHHAIALLKETWA